MAKPDEKPAGGGEHMVNAQYIDPGLPEYRDNPLIAALPPILTVSDVEDVLATYPHYDLEERDLPDHLRYHCIQRLYRYFEPLSRHFDLQERLSALIRQGYIGRNPMTPDYVKQLQNGYKRVQERDLTAFEHDVRSTANSFAMIGCSGVGKTTAIERILSLYPQVIKHSAPLNIHQVSWLKLDCPYDGSIKQLCISFFLKLDELLGTNYQQKYASRRRTIDEMMAYMTHIANLHCLGVLIVDEIQHLNLAKSGGSDAMLNFFVTLVNMIGVPVILIGTMKALPILQGDFRQARRSSGIGGMVWERIEGTDWEFFIEGLWEYQWTKNESPLTDELKSVMYDESQGIVDIVVKLYMLAQLRAISTGVEKIETPLIRQVAKDNLKLVAPMLKALRTGNLDEIVKYDDIRPINIEELFLNQLAKAMSSRRSASRTDGQVAKPIASARSLETQIVSMLAPLGIGEDVAKVAVAQVLENTPDISPLSLAQEVMKLVTGQTDAAPAEKVKVQRRKSKVDESYEVPDGDLRRIVAEAANNGMSAYDALRANGLIKAPAEEFGY